MKKIEMTVTFTKEQVNYKDKTTGEAKSFEKLLMVTPNGKSMEIRNDRFNYRVVDYINELIDEKSK